LTAALIAWFMHDPPSRASSASLPARYHWRILVAGRAVEYRCLLGLLNDRAPVATLKKGSWIVRLPDAGVDADYSREIPKNLPLGCR
jgi:hypothetical protein